MSGRGSVLSAPLELQLESITRLRRVEVSLAILGGLAASLVAFDFGGPVRLVLALVAWLLVPGWVFVRRLNPRDLAFALGLTILASAAIHTIVSLALVWTEAWQPRSATALVLLVSSLVILFWPPPIGTEPGLFESYRDRALTVRPAELMAWLAISGAAVLWVVALTQTHVDDLDQWGLLTAFPPIWYLAVAVLFFSCLIALMQRQIPALRLGASLTLLVIVLNASASLVETVPRLPWVYKHLAVTRYIELYGSIDPSIDLYNRWPGFFSMSAALDEVLGIAGTISWASYAEVAFALLDTALVLAIARTVSRNAGFAWTTAIVFTVCNWVGQNYFSPQAFGFSIYLTVTLIALRYLRGNPRKVPAAVERLVTRAGTAIAAMAGARATTNPASGAANAPHSRGVSSVNDNSSVDDDPSVTVGRGYRVAAVVAIVMLQAVVTASHQLSPYLVVLALVPLFVLGYLRPWWLSLALVAIPVLYLVPHYAYMQEHFGLFTGFNPFANVTYEPETAATVTAAGALQSQGVVLLSGITVALAFAGFVRRILDGQVRTTLIVGWLAVAPMLTLLAQSYGGEAKFRVFMFGLPWFAMGVAWLFWPGVRVTRRATLGLAASLTVMVTLFVATYFQPEADLRVSGSDVSASNWLDERVELGDSVVTFGPPFPTLTGPNYADLLGTPQGLAVLTDFGGEFPGGLNAISVLEYTAIAGVRGDTYIVFSDSQEEYSAAHEIYPAGQLDLAEKLVNSSAEFEPVYANDGVRIYRHDSTTVG